MAWTQNGREYSCIHTMSREEIDKAKKASKAQYGPWVMWTGEMMKKVLLRRACKLEFIGEPEMERIIEIDNKEYDRPARQVQQPDTVNYADVQPLDEQDGVVSAEIIDAPAGNGEADE